MSTSKTLLLHIAPQYGPHIVMDPATGVIKHVGTEDEIIEVLAADPDLTAQVDYIDGGLVQPSMTDAHDHVVADAYSRVLRDPRLFGVEDKAQALALIKAECATRRAAGNTNYVLFRDGIDSLELTASDLDEVSDGLPIVVFDPSNHGGVANSLVLASVKEESLGRDSLSGGCTPQGHLTDSYASIAKNLAFAAVSDAQLEVAIEEMLLERMAVGTTSVHDMGVRSGRDLKVIAQLKQRWEETRGIPFPITRAYIMFLGLVGPDPVEEVRLALARGDIIQNDLAWIGIKYFADGAFGSRTAYLSDDYEDVPGEKGKAASKPAEVIALLVRAAALGINEVAVHAIGDRAILEALEVAEAWQAIARSYDRDPSRFRVEHCELPLPREEVLKRAKDMGIWLVFQPNFVLDEVYRDRLGGRVEDLNSQGAAHREGVNMMFGTDRMPASPLFAMACAVMALYAHQQMSFEDALRYFTEVPAAYEGSRRGKLEVGQRADVIVFDTSLQKRMENVGLILERARSGKNVSAEVQSAVADLHEAIKQVFVAGSAIF